MYVTGDERAIADEEEDVVEVESTEVEEEDVLRVMVMFPAAVCAVGWGESERTATGAGPTAAERQTATKNC